LLCLLSLGQRLFQFQEIEGPGGSGGAWQPLQVSFVGKEQLVSPWEGPAQVMHQLTQISVRLRFRRVRPEEKGQMRAILGRIVMQDQIGKQRLNAGHSDGSYWSLTQDQPEVAQQMDMQRRAHSAAPFQTRGMRLRREMSLCLLIPALKHSLASHQKNDCPS
jgi:hypothetical protein